MGGHCRPLVLRLQRNAAEEEGAREMSSGTRLDSYAASHTRAGGVCGVGMCFMDILAQFVRRRSQVKDFVALPEPLFLAEQRRFEAGFPI